MKKVLSAVAALGIVAGLAASASAVEMKLKGYYLVEGVYFDHGDGSGVALGKTTPESSSDAWLMHTFHIQPTLVANDKVKMVADIYLADDTFWGQDDTATGPATYTVTETGVAGTSHSVTDNQGNVEVHKLFLEYISPIGKWRIGRHLANPFGTSFLDTELHQDRIMWWPSFLAGGGFKTLLFHAKIAENDSLEPTNDRDTDYYEARIFHDSAPGKMVAGLSWTNKRDVANQKYDKYRFKAAGSYTFGNIYLNAEYHYDFGTMEFDAATADRDLETHAAMADIGFKAGRLDAGGMFIYASGDDNGNTDNEMSAAMTSGQGNNGLGENFEPYYILTGRSTGIFNPRVHGLDTAAATAGIISIGAHVDYQVNAQLNLHAAIGYAMADAEPTGFNDEYGTEFNLGLGYKLLDNLTYAVHAGYLVTGDFFKKGAIYTDVEDVMLLSHHLTMEF